MMRVSLRKIATFYLSSLLYPGFREFISMGYGIESRYERNRTLWEQHCRCTKEFITAATNMIEEGFSVLVLGSGRLYDFPLEICHRASKVTFLDADPVSLGIARKKTLPFKDKVCTVHADITAAFKGAAGELKAALSSDDNEDAAAKAVQALSWRGSDISVEKHDVVISLNLLGQLPVYFRDRWGAIIEQKTGLRRSDRDAFPQVLEAALCRQFAALQTGHLATVQQLARKMSVYIYDKHFFYYEKDRAPWECYDALYIDTLLEEFSSPPVLESSWLWHLAPQGIEEELYGSIHQIEAFAFEVIADQRSRR